MEETLKKRKQRIKAAQPHADTVVGLTDSEKIKLQLLLDVAAYGKQLFDLAGKGRRKEVNIFKAF